MQTNLKPRKVLQQLKPITTMENGTVIKACQLSKTPETDGFTSEFHQSLYEHL